MQRMAARKKEPVEYWPEALGILVIVIYFINYIVGSSKNRAIAGRKRPTKERKSPMDTYIATNILNNDTANTHTYMFTYIQTFTYIYTLHTHTHKHTHTHTFMYMCVCIHTYIHTYVHTYI